MGIITTALKNAKFTKKGLLTKVAGPAFYGYQGIEAFKERQDEGDGFFSSALQGVGEAIIYSTLVGTAAELIGWGIENVPGMITQQEAALRREEKYAQVPFANSTFNDQPQFATMRQAGMALAQKSAYNIKQAMLGNEAQHMHRR